MMLRSGNDAAVALAIYCGGTVEGFAELMNDKARLLGLTGSHFENPHGLDSPSHYSTAKDLAILSAYAIQNPIFARTVSAKSVTVGDRVMQNHNKLLWRVEGVDGVKTGYTKAAGRILVSSAMRQGRRLIAVTINDGNDWADHAAMLEKGYGEFSLQTIVTKDQCLGSVAVMGGAQDRVNVLAAQDFSYALSGEEKPHIVLSGPDFVYAPAVEGKAAGYAYICIGEKSVGKIPLIFETTVELQQPERKPFWKAMVERILK